jgi:branched-chain amino acid transport system substrate-binding protein
MPVRSGTGKMLLALWLVLAGCPTRFDPRAETRVTTGDPEADHAYREARARMEVGDLKEALQRFAGFVEKWPNDPLAASAKLGEARCALSLGEAKRARDLAAPLAEAPDEGTKLRARFLLGLALHKTNDPAKSRELLRPFVGQIAHGDDEVELHAVLADDAARLGDSEDALREYDLFFANARAVEKLYVRDRVSELVAKLSAADALRMWNVASKEGVGAAYLGRRVAADFRQAGNEAMARQVLDESRSAREHAGLEEAQSAPRRVGLQRAVGCVLPLSGKSRAYGERALHGALLAAEVMDVQLASGAPVELRVRDSSTDPARASSAVEELAQEGVAALLGSPDRFESQAAATRAEALGVPLLELAPDNARRSELIFKLVRDRASAASALVRRAQKAGARTAAILAPDSAYGRSMAEAFATAARSAGLRVLADLHYPDASTTFIDPVKKIESARPDALFVPAPASQLALIAPQLSASGLVRMQGVKPAGKLISVYATADGINQSFIASTAKYLDGAILAPTFYPDQSDPHVAAFVDRYRAAYGEDPNVLDALAFDAVRAVRVALDHEGSSPTRQALATQLAHLGETGLTGELAFTASGDRAGTPPLYTVDGDTVHAVK